MKYFIMTIFMLAVGGCATQGDAGSDTGEKDEQATDDGADTIESRTDDGDKDGDEGEKDDSNSSDTQGESSEQNDSDEAAADVSNGDTDDEIPDSANSGNDDTAGTAAIDSESDNDGSSESGDSETSDIGDTTDADSGTQGAGVDDSGTLTDTSWPIDEVTGTPVGYIFTNDFHGCAWTRTDALDVGTTIAPEDFRDRESSEDYCITGTLGGDSEAVAMFGLNITEPSADANCSAAAQATAPVQEGVAPMETGLAVRLDIRTPVSTIDVALLSQNSDGLSQSWCYMLDVAGKIGEQLFFAPYSEFSTVCGPDEYGKAYENEPIAAVAVRVHGESGALTDYDLCVVGMVDGDDTFYEEDPPWELGPYSGIVGGDGGYEKHYDRKMVVVDGERYIIQNNFQADAGYQTLTFYNNSFEITEHVCEAESQSTPISFPSIYIGQNGNQALSTIDTDDLPKRLSEVTRISTSFSWSGRLPGSWENQIPAVEIWLAVDNPPYYGSEYGVPVSGVVALWFENPDGRQPSGTLAGEVDVEGIRWSLWGAATGSSPDYPDLPHNRPAITFVAQETVTSIDDFDLKAVLEIVANADIGGYSVQPDWYVTDIIAGFQIWDGDPVGLKVDEFVVRVDD